MFTYTPKPEYLRMMRTRFTGSYRDAVRRIAGPSYAAQCAIEREYAHVRYSSPRQVSHVPVGGHLIDAAHFECAGR